VFLEHPVVVEVHKALGEVPADAKSDDVKNGEGSHRVQEHLRSFKNIQSSEKKHRIKLNFKITVIVP
jgi:hypothetical protein